jgi:hypothetical protein
MTLLDRITPPADASNFRAMVNGKRWYVDNLPGCDIADADDTPRPSYSNTKPPFTLGEQMTLTRIAGMPGDELNRIAALDPTERRPQLVAYCKSAGEISMNRGTIIHWWMEDATAGLPFRTFDEIELAALRIPRAALIEAERYKTAIVDLFDTYQPELVGAEYVVMNRTLNGVGYGCTPDGIWRLDGKLYGVDYKSRPPHQTDAVCYPEEGSQIAAGAFGDYMIVGGMDGNAHRAHLPKLDGGLVISVQVNGCRLYPIDLDVAWRNYTDSHAWYLARGRERDAIGRVWPVKRPKTAPAPTPPPPPSTPKTQVGAMPSEPDEGGPADEAAVNELEAKYVALDPITKGRVNEIATDANRAGVPIHLKNNRTRRRYFIVKALVALAGADGASDNDIRTLVATVLDTEAAWFPAVTVGRCVGALDADQAEHFHLLAHLHIGGLTVIDTGAPFTRFTTEWKQPTSESEST